MKWSFQKVPHFKLRGMFLSLEAFLDFSLANPKVSEFNITQSLKLPLLRIFSNEANRFLEQVRKERRIRDVSKNNHQEKDRQK